MSIKISYNPQQVRMLNSFRRLFDAKWKSRCKHNNNQNEEELENDADNFLKAYFHFFRIKSIFTLDINNHNG